MAKRKAENGVLPGMETARIPSVTNAARKYVAARDERMEMQKSEGDLKGRLSALMEKYDIESYKHGDVEILRVEGEATIKVKANKDLPPEPEDAS